MKLKELEAVKIVEFIMGKRGELKSEEQLSVILKKRLTKKEMLTLQAKVTDAPLEQTLARLNVDETRHATILAGAIKKVKNESTHREFYEGAGTVCAPCPPEVQ